jgi:UDP-N-acetylglucosamine--N-acetylmuramyl-(pentapeptide) pyrophosphoryl-undecaprenol N-acetylglucosamine transferase
MTEKLTIQKQPATKKSKRIIIAGGGTGGHIFPAIAIANSLKDIEPLTEILFVGAAGKMEMEKVPQAGYKITGLYIAGYNRNNLLKNIGLPFMLIKSFLQVTNLIRSFRPDGVLGVGGYSSFPVVRMAQTRGIPTFIHESNSLAGRTNMILAKRATKIFVASEEMNQYFPAKKIMVTGNPVRNIFKDCNIIRSEAIEFFGLRPEKRTVFVMGGSLGAKSINEAIAANIQIFKKHNIQLIWQTGKPFAGDAAKFAAEESFIWTNAFIDKMEYAYTAADVVVSRAGAMAIAELAVVGKPVVFVPYPFAAEDHQTANARELVKADAALMVNNSDADTKLVSTIIALINNNEQMVDLKKNISRLGNNDADEKIAAEILKALNN